MGRDKYFTLNTGYRMPTIGLGTWQSGPNEVRDAVATALKCGYRHIDAAAVYGNEEEVGAGIKLAGVARDEIFITSKLWNTHHDPKDVEEALDKSLKDLQLDYVDLYLIHWPVAFRKSSSTIQPIRKDGYIDVVDVSIKDTWAAMEKMVRKGKVRSIGVSNFTRQKIEDLMQTSSIKPAVNQIEAHPYLQQRDLLEWCKKEKIVITGYSPLGNNIYNIPRAVDDPIVVQTAQDLGKTPAQILINWAVQRGTVVLPKSVTPERIRSNLEEFELPPKAYKAIQNMERHQRMNFPARLGVDIFGETSEEFVKQKATEWVEAQKQAKR